VKSLSMEERFWSRVNNRSFVYSRPELGMCWLWMGSRHPKGYGDFWDGCRIRKASQVAWELHHGTSFPVGMQACHHCDNPSCVRWSHIFAGTNSKNQLDSASKKRHRNARLNVCSRGHSLLDESNLYHYQGKRKCRACLRIRDSEFRARNKTEVN
jgi:hypothetical protein